MDHFKLCEAEISLEEIAEIVDSQKNNKSSGNDRLTAELYKHLSNDIASVLLDGYNS